VIHQPLGFSWLDNGVLSYFIFLVLPFGLTSAPFFFTKVMRSLVKHWRQHCVKIGCFLDDGLGISSTKDIAFEDSKFVQNSLIASGFVVNEAKSLWCPVKQLTWLGIEVDTKNSFFTIPRVKILSTLSFIKYIKTCLPYVSARTLAQLCGKLNS